MYSEAAYASALASALQGFGFTPDVIDQFARFAAIVAETNKQLNLTRIIEPAEMAVQHFADSLEVLRVSGSDTWISGADIGSGAGFPVVPLAIALPQCRWTAIESVRKKATFIVNATRTLRLGNVHVESARAEDVARSDQRATFDVVTTRAVGAIIPLCEVGLPLLRPGGLLLPHKTESATTEVDQGRATIEFLGGNILAPHQYSLPADRQPRSILIIRKNSETPDQYPRAAGVPFKRPLERPKS